MIPAQARSLAARLLLWYEAHHRDLPWRETADRQTGRFLDADTVACGQDKTAQCK